MIDVLPHPPMPLSAFRPPYGSSPLHQQPFLSSPLRQLPHGLSSSARKPAAEGELAWPRSLNQSTTTDRGLPRPTATFTPPPAADRTNAANDERMATYSRRPVLTHAGGSGNNTLKSLYQDQASANTGGTGTVASYEAPVERQASAQADYNGTKTADEIASYLQVPASVNNSKGSLSDLVAQLTCLFWFESATLLHRIADAGNHPVAIEPLGADTQPRIAFRKWITTLLSTTQVSQQVILIALLFIYRLKMHVPVLMGKAGSEYRLLTVALMLGNKFLDDNTYTNKTWADVAGMSVGEVHEMEVEFLSNVKYNLFVNSAEWDRWHRRLGRFNEYFERATSATLQSTTTPSLQPTMLPTPVSQHPSPYFGTAGLPSANIHTPVPTTLAPYLAPPAQAVAAHTSGPENPHLVRQRKRSREDDSSYGQPPAKRLPERFSGSLANGDVFSPAYSTASTHPTPPSLHPRQVAPSQLHQLPHPHPQHPAPQLPMPNNAAIVGPTINQMRGGAPPPHQAPYAGGLPPPPVVGRAMASVYGNSLPAHALASTAPPTATHPAAHPAALAPAPLHIRIPPHEHFYPRPTPPLSTGATPAPGGYPAPPPAMAATAAAAAHHHHTAAAAAASSRQNSPIAALTPTSGPYTPTHGPATAAGVHPPPPLDTLSPATRAFVHRNSPYRPVQGVSTLLMPPRPPHLGGLGGSGGGSDGAAGGPGGGAGAGGGVCHGLPHAMPPADARMQYLPLGKGVRERRSGVVPLVGAAEVGHGAGMWYQPDAAQR